MVEGPTDKHACRSNDSVTSRQTGRHRQTDRQTGNQTDSHMTGPQVVADR